MGEEKKEEIETDEKNYSIKSYEEKILSFLKSKEPGAFLITGNWGIGKTYFWNKFYQENNDKFNHTEYSYVSLFGINNINETKLAIFEKGEKYLPKTEFQLWINIFFILIMLLLILGGFFFINKNYSQYSNYIYLIIIVFILLTTKLFNYKPFVKEILDLFPFANNLHFGGVKISNIGYKLLLANIEGQLICFDDLERKGKDFDINEFLGLVDYLKNEKKCKIIVICNEDQLDDIDKSESKDIVENTDKNKFLKQKEKVFDQHIVFSPSITQNMDYLFTKVLNDNLFKKIKHINKEFLIKNFSILEVNNIRIFEKTLFFINFVLEFDFIDEEENKILIENIIHSLVLFCVSKYCSNQNENIPDLEFIKKYSFGYDILTGEKISEQQTNRNSILHNYNFSNCSDLDKSLIKYLENGILDEEFLKNLEVEINNIQKNNAESELKKIIGKIRNSLKDNSEEIDSLFKKFSDNNCFINLSVSSFSSFLYYIEEIVLGNIDIDDLVKRYFNSNKKQLQYIKEDDDEYKELELDYHPKVREQFKKNDIIERSITLEYIFVKYKDKNNLNISELKILNEKITEDDFKIFFSKYEDEIFRFFINELYKISINYDLNNISDNIISCFKSFESSGTALNKIRSKKLLLYLKR